MAGRALIPESHFVGARHFSDPLASLRRRVLRETLAAFDTAVPLERYQQLAQRNLSSWQRTAVRPRQKVLVEPGDWGEVTQRLTQLHGHCFAVLNMANAFVPGGAYVEGAAAQEENMFRRSDCHFHIDHRAYDLQSDRYLPHMTRLLSAGDGEVYLDVEHTRVCIRGAENRAEPGLGYAWLADNEVFPFYEMRAAAQDLRYGDGFDEPDARKRIVAQLETLIAKNVRYAVLSAFGCGAFENPATIVAAIYREEIESRSEHFDLIAFAIFNPGYGPDNFSPFLREMSKSRLTVPHT